MVEIKREYIPPTRQLCALRAVRGFTQAEIAEYLCLTPSSYSRKERGELLFNIREINALLDLFSIPFEKIFRVPRNGRLER